MIENSLNATSFETPKLHNNKPQLDKYRVKIVKKNYQKKHWNQILPQEESVNFDKLRA